MWNETGWMLSVKRFYATRPKKYLSELARRRDREKPLDTLPQAEMDKLCTLDEYPSDSFTFSAFGYDLHIRDELVAGAFATLPEQEQQILILRFVAAMADGEIGGLVRMPASAIQPPPLQRTLN